MNAETDNTIMVPVTKAKRSVPVDISQLPIEVYKAAIAQGLKDFLNKGMSKIAVKDLEDEELEAAQDLAFEKAEENLKALMEGKLGRKRSVSKDTQEVLREAVRLAKLRVKAAYKSANKKLPSKQSEITAAAKELIEENPSILQQARENIKRQKDQEQAGEAIEIRSEGRLAKLIEEAEDMKPKVAPKPRAKGEKAPLSATQVRRPAPRAEVRAH